MLRARLIGVCAALLATPVMAGAQSISAWLDVHGAHSRPPSGTTVDAANYGLMGSRLRIEGGRSAFELAATHGRGVENENGSWLTGRAAFDATRIHGAADFGVRAEGSGLTYLTPVRIGADDEYSQSVSLATVRPFAGLSIGALRIGAEAVFSYGVWQSELSTQITGGPPLPVPGNPPGEFELSTERDDGEISLAGGAATLLRVVGPATVELRGGSYSARNQAADGRYSGVDATVALSLGALDVTLAGRHWETPTGSAETGGHAGVGVPIGSGAYLHVSAGHSVSDPLYGSRGGAGVSAGISVRLGRRALGPPLPATVGPATAAGRTVSFTLRHTAARSVAVAGDFSGWEPRSLQRRTDGVWTLETVIEPGVYHYSFVVDGETWMVPDSATGVVDDGFGRKNATLVVRTSPGGVDS